TVAAHVAIPAVLVADVVVGEGHHADRARGEGVPEPAPLRLAAVVGQREPSLISVVAERAIATFVLVVARSRHPWSVARRPRVVLEAVRPGGYPIRADVGVAEVTVQQMEERSQALDLVDHVSGPRRGGDAVPGHRRAQIPEAGEPERCPSRRRG